MSAAPAASVEDGAQPGGSLLSVQESFEAALTLLRGTLLNHVLCVMAMVVSLTSSCVVYVAMANGDRIVVTMTTMSLLFLVSQAFTLSKVSRDRKMAAMANPETAAGMACEFLRPTREYQAQVLGFFLASVGFAVYSLSLVDVELEWYGSASLSMLWVLVSSLCLSKSVRDRNDAKIWAATAETDASAQTQNLRHVVRVCSGTPEYVLFVWTAFLASSLLTLAWTWVGFDSEQLAVERKAFLSLGLIFNMTSCFHMAKLVRDLQHAEKALELKRQLPFQVLVIASFAVSLLVPLGAVLVMPLRFEQRTFLLVGQLMTANVSLNLAKLVRDRLERDTLAKSLPVAA